MKTLRSVRVFVLAPALVALAVGCAPAGESLPGQGEDEGRTVVYRDTWGVAHIYAPTVEDGLYAMGWAQAQDRPEQILRNFLLALGEYASVAGPDAVQSDLRSRMWDHYGIAEAKADEIPEEIRGHYRAYAQGVNDFYAQHPEDRPEWWGDRRVDEHMSLAFTRLFLYNWSIDEGYDDLRRAGIEPGYDPAQRGSNQFAVAPGRSASGAALLLIDPHLSWWGPSRFWEFRIHAGALHGSGVTLPGTPYIGLGHNENLAWAMTTGGPDTADVYELTLDPDDPDRYRYDGEWREMTSREVTVEVRGEEPQTHTLWFSHHGPLIARRDGKAYALKIAYAETVRVGEAWRELNFGEDYQGVVRALATLTMFPQNVMAADTSGNIYYQRTGRTPRRPEGYDWSRPVDGSTSATEWLGIHPASDHLQVLNPPHGYMQNCNIPPDAMMVESPFSLDKTVDYIYSSRDYGPRSGWTNQRGARAVELLEGDDSVTVEEAMAYGTDVRPYGVDRWLEVLARAQEGFAAEILDDEDQVLLAELLSWDGELRRDSEGGLRYSYFRHQLDEDLGEGMSELAGKIDAHYDPVLGKTPPDPEVSEEDLRAMLRSFASAMDRLAEVHGATDAVYGDRFRVGRDDASWPVGGGGGRIGLTTLRNMGYGPEREDGTRWGRSGQTSTQIVHLTRPIESWTYLPVGQSDRPDSPHYDDQAEKLFSPRQLKATWWLPEDLAGHIESRTVLERGE